LNYFLVVVLPGPLDAMDGHADYSSVI